MPPPPPPRPIYRPPLTQNKSGRIYQAGIDPISPPKCIYQPLPSYTDEAKAARVEGKILIQGIIRKDGHIDNLIVLQGLGYGLDEHALEIVAKEWRFEPGTLNSDPVDVKANIEISFRLY
jgi:TonB family protein